MTREPPENSTADDIARGPVAVNASPDNVLDFVPPDLGAANIPPSTEEPKLPPTQGEILVGYSFNPSGDFKVTLMKLRGSKCIDQLANLPLRTTEKDGQRYLDANHRMIVEEAIRRQMDATMWAVKALTWTGQ